MKYLKNLLIFLGCSHHAYPTFDRGGKRTLDQKIEHLMYLSDSPLHKGSAAYENYKRVLAAAGEAEIDRRIGELEAAYRPVLKWHAKRKALAV